MYDNKLSQCKISFSKCLFFYLIINLFLKTNNSNNVASFLNFNHILYPLMTDNQISTASITKLLDL